MPSGKSLKSALLRCYAAGKLPEALALIPMAVRLRALQDWSNWMHPHQQEPEGSDWRLWLVLGGRGSGKSRAGAEWIRLRIRYSNHPLRVALVAPSLQEARAVMVEGESGLLAVHPAGDRPLYMPSRREIVFDNGSIAQLFSAASPDLLRGPQFHLAWCDELAKWRHAEKTWNMLQFALRLGERPQQAVTTTPRPLPLLKQMIADPQTVLSRAPTIANAGFLAPSFLRELQRLYGGTMLGRQELDGELIDDNPDALFQRCLFDQYRRSDPPPLARIVVAVDPPVSASARSDACGIVCAALGEDDRAYVLDDMTTQGVSPSHWASRAIALFHAREADVIVAEVNQGGNLVTEILRGIDPNVPVRTVTATRGKYIRAEPVAALYEQGRVSHVGTFPDLEDEMCAFTACGTRSADRVDALVWALTELVLRPTREPRIRTI
jgi:predicted phage terminase large subunit-like protein